MENEYYKKDGKFYERVTRITDYFCPPDLLKWKVETGKTASNRISKIALNFGSRVHNLIELGQEPKKTDKPEVIACLRAWESWKAKYLPTGEIIQGKTLYCEKRGIAGTPDFGYENTNGLYRINTLVDIKTSREVKPINFVQLGGYASMMDKRPDILAILRLDKTLGDFEYVTNEKIGMSVDQCIAAFNYLLGYYRFYKQVQSTLKGNAKGPMAQGEEE